MDEIKIVINIKGTRAVIGVNSPGCDPVFTTVEGSLVEILGNTAQMVTAAQEKWKTTKKNPKIDIPQPAPKEETTATTGAKPVPAAKSAKDQIQQPMF